MNRIPKDKSPMKSISHTGLVPRSLGRLHTHSISSSYPSVPDYLLPIFIRIYNLLKETIEDWRLISCRCWKVAISCPGRFQSS